MKAIKRKETKKDIVSNVILFYVSVMLILPIRILLCFHYDYFMLLLYLHYTENSYDSNDITLTQLVLKCKSESYEGDEILED